MGFDLMSSVKTEDLEPAWQNAYRQRLADAATAGSKSRLDMAGESYPGQLTAGLSEFETRGLDLLGDALDKGPATNGESFKATQGALASALNPGDPSNREYYQAYRQAAMRELSNAKDSVRASRSTSDAYGGSGLDRAEGKLESDTIGNLANVLGGLIDSDRNAGLGAIQNGMTAAQTQQNQPLEYAAAATALGDLPRSIEQANYDAQYQEWMRSLNDLGIPLDVAAGLITYQPPIYVSQHEGAIKAMGNAVSSMGGGMGGGGGGMSMMSGSGPEKGEYRYEGDTR